MCLVTKGLLTVQLNYSLFNHSFICFSYFFLAKPKRRLKNAFDLLEVVKPILNHDLIAEFRTVYKFVVNGESGGTFYLDLKNGNNYLNTKKILRGSDTSKVSNFDVTWPTRPHDHEHVNLSLY